MQWHVALAVAVLLPAGWPAATYGQDLSVSLEQVTGGLTGPIGIEHAGDGSGRLFVIEQAGTIRIIAGGTLQTTPFLDVADRISAGGERGLLGLAFHPDYTSNGRFFIHYSEDTAGDTVVARCLVSTDDPDRGDESSCDVIFTLPQPFGNHNGGKLAFGPDGHLYLALGDGGSGGDPEENAQDTSDLHGAILRLDVDGDDFPVDPERDYAIPPDNPFVGQAGADEIWAYGLRNPWRFSFDRLTGDLWIGDVGQNAWEEVNFEPAGDPGGRNYGWDVLEGNHCFEDEPSGSCDDFLAGGSTLPVLEYPNNGAGHCSVTGGFRYRGVDQPQLFGVYVFADFCSGTVWGALPTCTGEWEFDELTQAGFRISTFGEDEAGELYLAEFSSTEGEGSIHRVVVANDTGERWLTANPDVVQFGEHQSGDLDVRELLFQHTGAGPGTVEIGDFELSDAFHFALDAGGGSDPCGPATVSLGPGQDCTANVIFGPEREGGFDEILCVSGNMPPVSIALRATVPCSGQDDETVANDTVESDQFFNACLNLSIGPDVTVETAVHAEFRAGESVSLNGPFTLHEGGSMALITDPVLAQ